MKGWFLRAAFFGLPLLFLATAIFVLNAGPILKRPFNGTDDVPKAMNRVSDSSLAGRWEEADQAFEELDTAWNQIRNRIRLSLGAEEIGIFDLELGGLQGAVEARDPTEVRIALRRIMGLWEDLGS